jgi:16S rRNA processing protein RimM
MKIEDCFYIGYITKTKGLKGEVQVFFEYEEPDDLELETLFVEINGKLTPYFVSSYKLQNNQTGYFFFDDIDTIEKAEKIIRKKLYLPNNIKPEADPDDLTYKDLKGFIVHDQKHGELGEIITVHEYPQQFIAVVPYRFREIMFPLNDEIIKAIDAEEGVITVSLPEGLLEVYLGENESES